MRLSDEKGITIVALVSTIIVFLIIIAVSIGLIIGPNSVTRSAENVTYTSVAQTVQDHFAAYAGTMEDDFTDIFGHLLSNGELAEFKFNGGKSLYYITRKGMEKIASGYVEDINPRKAFLSIAALSGYTDEHIEGQTIDFTADNYDSIYNQLKKGNLFLVDKNYNIVYMRKGEAYGEVSPVKAAETPVDAKWWVEDTSP